MGNQNTSGFIETAVEKGTQEATKSHENVLENELKDDDLKERSGGVDFSSYVEADPGHSIEDLGANDIDTSTQMNAMPNESSNDTNVKGSISEEGMFGDAINEMSCKLKEEVRTNGLNSEVKMEPSQEENILTEAMKNGQGYNNSDTIETESDRVECIDDNLDDVASEDEFIESDTVLDIQGLSERHADEEDLGTKVSDNDGMTNGFSDSFIVEGENKIVFKEKSAMSNEESSNLDTSMVENQDQSQNLAENETSGKFDVESDIDELVLEKEPLYNEENTMAKINGESDGDKSVVKAMSILDEETKSKSEQDEIVFDNKEIPQVQVDDLTKKVENHEHNEQMMGNIIEHDIVTNNPRKDQNSPLKYNVEQGKNTVLFSNMISELKISAGPISEPNVKDMSVQVELRKSPSFDFGIVPCESKFQESDQTPLLYDRTATRSFSALRFQCKSVQTEYFEKSLVYEPVNVEENTIRINSEFDVNENFQDNNILKVKQDEGDMVSLPKGIGKKKKTRTSSIFTTCICCTKIIN